MKGGTLDTVLKVDVARLDPEGETFAGELDGAAVLDLREPYLKPTGALRYELDVQLLGKELLVRGRAEQDFAAVCSRCGADFAFTVSEEDLTFSLETDEKTEFADLTDELRQSIILALPTYPICREDCRGVCPTCGKNLNEGPCSCARKSEDGRWGALDALRLG